MNGGKMERPASMVNMFDIYGLSNPSGKEFDRKRMKASNSSLLPISLNSAKMERLISQQESDIALKASCLQEQ